MLVHAPAYTTAKNVGFRIVERTFSSDSTRISVGLANIHASVPDVEANKAKVCRVASIFKERGVNVAVARPPSCFASLFAVPAVKGRSVARIPRFAQPGHARAFAAVHLNGEQVIATNAHAPA